MPSVANPDRPVTVNSSTMETRNPTSAASAHPQNAQGHAATAGAAGKKAKGKKNPDPVDTNKLVEQHLARLERDVAGDKEQDAEIGMHCSRALPWFCVLGLGIVRASHFWRQVVAQDAAKHVSRKARHCVSGNES